MPPPSENSSRHQSNSWNRLRHCTVCHATSAQWPAKKHSNINQRNLTNSTKAKNTMARFQKTTGIGYAAYSSERLSPIVITIRSTSSLCSYYVNGPENLSHGSEVPFDAVGGCSLCEAATRALTLLTPARTFRLRAEMFATRALAVERGEIPEDAAPPKLPITMKTSSPTQALSNWFFDN
jgi:hypothetical protein